MRDAQWVGLAVAFFGAFIVAAVALYLVFDSYVLAITPALVVGACVAYAVHLSQRNRNPL